MILINKKLLVLLLTPVTLILSACAAVLPLASATYVTVASSAAASQTTKIPKITNRSDADTLKDHNLAIQVETTITEKIPTGRYSVASFNQKILITGEVPTKTDTAKVTAAASHVGGVIKVWNYLTVEPNETEERISLDSSLCETTKKRLIDRQMTKQDINSNNITVTVTKGVIYLIGSNAGSQQAIEEVMTSMKNIDGVAKVINLIDQ
jgi:osmotically-inducible protein OsmY